MIPDIGIPEFILLSLVALIFIKPDDWPRVLRKVGYYYGQVHDFMMQAKDYSRRTYYDITEEPYDPRPDDLEPSPAVVSVDGEAIDDEMHDPLDDDYGYDGDAGMEYDFPEDGTDYDVPDEVDRTEWKRRWTRKR